MKVIIGWSLAILFLLGCNTIKSDEAHIVSLAQHVNALGFNHKDLLILIDKSDYKLSVTHNGTIVRQYPIVFGANPIDDKLMEGDKRTPEGVFRVRDHYPHKSWSKFIWIDYPTKDSWVKHNRAKSRGLIPNTAEIGGEIGIHGVPANSDNLIQDGVNWTWGCVALLNKDINDLYTIIQKGTKVEIVK